MCPNCDHTLQQVATNFNVPLYWCPRCGTLVDRTTEAPEKHEITVPFLPTRVRGFLDESFSRLSVSDKVKLHTGGILESVYKTDQRPRVT